MGNNALVSTIRQNATEEIVAALGLPRHGLARRICGPLFWPPAHLFARQLAEAEPPARTGGLPAASRQLLPRFVSGVVAAGAEDIPRQGPLLIVSNHPGAYDALVILSNVPRPDVKFVVSDVPILHSLPAVSSQMIYTPPQPERRAQAVREIMRTLRQGGAVLIYPSGLVDPDPVSMPGAEEALNLWSKSIALILSRVPETALQVAIVSGVLAPACMRNPLTRLPKERWRQQKLAEFIQVIQQLLFKRDYGLTPRVYFSRPRLVDDLLAQSGVDNLHQWILESADEALRQNLAMYG